MFQLYDEKHQRRYPLTGLIKEIGRTSECDVCIPDDEKVSRLHARLEWNGTAWVLVDGGSTNGTFVNGQKITEMELHPGDQIEIGDTPLRFLPLPMGDVAASKKTTEVSRATPLAVQQAKPAREADATRKFSEGVTQSSDTKK
jgi:pSer/pThr/pTyr-binding forkhead associated (FHA) protein